MKYRPFAICRRLAAGFALACASVALAQAPSAMYPAKPVRVIVGVSPGSAADIPARAIGQKLGEALGQQFLIDNRPGAGGNIAAEIVAKSPPDGYTMLLGSIANAINTALYSRLPFDFARDFSPIALAASAPNLLVVHPSVPARSVADLIRLAKAQPGTLNYASVGPGTVPHLAGELFKSMAGINVVHIPYKGGPQATTDLIGGQFPFMFGISANVLPHVASGRVRALAVTTAARLSWLPELPTVAESGLPGFEAVTWWGFLVPAGTSPVIVNRLNAEIVKALTHPEVRQQFAAQRIDGIGGTPEQFAAHISRETVKWAAVIRESGTRMEY
jgi:tripartite-type tricarboxylate transporter receptor subunit TctC